MGHQNVECRVGEAAAGKEGTIADVNNEVPHVSLDFL